MRNGRKFLIFATIPTSSAGMVVSFTPADLGVHMPVRVTRCAVGVDWLRASDIASIVIGSCCAVYGGHNGAVSLAGPYCWQHFNFSQPSIVPGQPLE